MLFIYMVLCTNMIHVSKRKKKKKNQSIDGRSRVFVGVKQ